MIEELQDIKSYHCGNCFRKVDLHVHSPASKDASWGDINEYDFLKYFEDKDFEMIAVTDHNSGEWIDKLISAAQNQRKRNNWKIRIVPGVEVSTGNIHLTVLFPEDTDSKKIGHFLSQLKIVPDDWGKPEQITELSPPAVCDIAHNDDFNGIVVGAHCKSDKGVIGGLNGQIRLKTLENIDILELNVDSESSEKIIKYVREDLGFTDIPFIFSSDSHKPDDICSKTCWLKMDECNFTGIQQLVFEPDLRCSYLTPTDPSFMHLIGISIVGGLYSGEQISLNPNLNVIIGGRGAGKSALIDLIRFTFGFEPKLMEDEKLFIDRITSFLNIGDKVRVFLCFSGKEYIIQRTMDFSESGPKSKVVRKLDTEPQIFEATSIEPLRIERSPIELFPIEIFAQGEVFGLTKRVDEQRKLIDEYIGTKPYFKEEKAILSKLKKNSKSIIKTQTTLNGEITKASNEEEIVKRISELEKHTEDEIFLHQDKWEDEKRFFDLSEQREKEICELSKNFDYELNSLPNLPSQTPNNDDIEQYSLLFNSLKDSVKDMEKTLQKSLVEEVIKLTKIRDDWKIKYDGEYDKLAEKLKELGVTDRAVIFKELQEKKMELKIIAEEIKPKIKKLEEVTQDHKKKRDELIQKLDQNRSALSKKRLELADNFNDQLENKVKISIDVESDPDQFIMKLNKIYDGSGIKSRDKLWINLIDNKITPMKLADLILLKDNAAIEAFGITSDAASKLIQHPELEQVYEIQTIKMEDVPKIYLKKEGEYDFTPLNELSFGEKCSAILSIVMLNKANPLIIDQPEDEIDHAFIIENIVETIRKIKHNRQLIISTHNPNIPVLGDAELVIKVKKIPRKNTCTVERARGLEDKEIMKHLKVLEGGPEAFQKRSQKYGLKVKI